MEGGTSGQSSGGRGASGWEESDERHEKGMQGKGVQAGTFAARDEDGQDGVRFVGRTALHAEHVRRSPREEHVLQHNVCCASLLPQQLPLLHGKLHPPSKLAANVHVGQRSSGLRATRAAIFVARACGG